MNRNFIVLILYVTLSACSATVTLTEPPTSPPSGIATKIPPTVAESTSTSPPPTSIPQPTDTSLPTETPLPSETATPEISPTPFECTDPLACVEIGPGVAIQAAYILDLSGPAVTQGQDSLNGLELAIERAGKLLGHDLELTGADDGCDPVKGRAAALEYAEQPELIAVFGTTCSRSARAVFPWLSQSGLVIISPSNTAPMLTEAGKLTRYPGYFRTIFSDKQQGIMAARLAIEKLNAKTAVTISSPNEFNLDIQAGFLDEFAVLGGEVLQKVRLEGSVNPASLLTSVAAKTPEMIYLTVDDINLAGELIAQVRETEGLQDTHIVSMEWLYNSDLENVAGLAADGVIISRGGLFPQTDAYNTEILPTYREKFGQEPPSIFHAFAIDAVDFLYAAIKQVGVVYPDGTLYIPRQALRDALYATQDFQGITGALACSDTGDCGDPDSIAFYTYQIGIWPPPVFWP